MNYYNVMNDGSNSFDQPVRSGIRTCDKCVKQMTALTGYLFDYLCFKENCRIFSIDSSKQQTLDIGPKSVQFHKKFRTYWEESNIFYYQRSQRNCLAFLSFDAKLV